MKVITYNNRVTLTFVTHKDNANSIYAIIAKHKGQSGLYDNSIGGSTISHDRSHIIPSGPTIGGTVIFHSHSCDHNKAAAELIEYFYGLGEKIEMFTEVAKTHKADGSAYKKIQYEIVAI